MRLADSCLLGTGRAAAQAGAGAPPTAFDSAPLERVLRAYVDARGKVEYAALKKKRHDLDRIVAQIAQVSPASAPQLFLTLRLPPASLSDACECLIATVSRPLIPAGSRSFAR